MKSNTNIKGFNVRHHYILTTAMANSGQSADEFSNDDANWLYKSRRLQIRRWRKIRNQEV